MMTLARSIDDDLLDRLQNASGKEQLQLADKVRQRLNKEQLPAAMQTKLVNVIAGSDNLAKYGYVEMLSSLAPGHGLESATIIAIAAALNSRVNHRPVDESTLINLLTSYDEKHRLPEKATQHLHEALTTNNVMAAISVLRAMPAEPPHFLPNAQALTNLLLHEYPYVRTSSIRTLAHYGKVRALPDITNAALVSVTNNDAFMHVRFEAFVALSGQSSADRPALAHSLAKQLTQPNREIWRASSGYTGYHDLEPHAIRLLAKWFELPYPSFVIDTLIAKSDRFHTVTVPLLEKVVQTQGFTAPQASALQEIAERHDQPATRQALYALMQTTITTNQESVPFSPEYNTALVEMATGKVRSKRIRAAYLLEHRFSSKVPMKIAAVAADVLMDGDDSELRGISARLVAKSDQPFVDREQTLQRALATHRNDDAIRIAWFSMYPANELERLLTNNLLLNQTLPLWVYTSAVFELSKYVTTNVAARDLQPETVNTLIRVAKTRNDYSLTGAAIGLLNTCHIEIPFTLQTYSKSFQSKALFGIYVFLAAIYLVLGLVSFVSLIAVPLSGATGRKRFGLLFLWSLTALVGLALFAWAMIGFIGHNSLPDPGDSLKFNLPLYAGMILLIAITGIQLRWARHRKA